MSAECNKCGLDDIECKCYVYELEERIQMVEERLNALTEIVKHTSQYIRKDATIYCRECKNESIACVCLREDEQI